MESTTAPSSRSQAGLSRAKAACLMCRQQKRKCDGRQPCHSCLKSQNVCHYAIGVKKSLTPPESKSADRDYGQRASDSSEPGSQPGSSKVNTPSMASRQKATSGMMFSETFGMSLNASNTPRIRNFAWNIGLRRAHESGTVDQLENLLNWPLYLQLSTAYARSVGSVYDFIDMTLFNNRVRDRFQTGAGYGGLLLDATICLICALGCLYSGNLDSLECSLYQSAKVVMDSLGERQEPSVESVMAYALKTIYLRTAQSPHAAWISSAVGLHLAEATGLHKAQPGVACDVCNLESLFWITRLLNRWISFEYGRTQVELRAVSRAITLDTFQEGTASMLRLLQISDCLDPQRDVSWENLENTLIRLEKFESSNHAVLLSRCVLTLAIYRRLRLESTDASSRQDGRILAIGNEGLHTIELILSDSKAPWWHLANLPFQFLCLALMIDTQESLDHIPRIMMTMEAVHNVFDTDTTREAVEYSKNMIHVVVSQKSRQVAQLETMLPQDLRSSHGAESQNMYRGEGGPSEDMSSNVMDADGNVNGMFHDARHEMNQYIGWDLFMNAAVMQIPASYQQ